MPPRPWQVPVPPPGFTFPCSVGVEQRLGRAATCRYQITALGPRHTAEITNPCPNPNPNPDPDPDPDPNPHQAIELDPCVVHAALHHHGMAACARIDLEDRGGGDYCGGGGGGGGGGGSGGGGGGGGGGDRLIISSSGSGRVAV